jgi:hypothetical protein
MTPSILRPCGKCNLIIVKNESQWAKANESFGSVKISDGTLTFLSQGLAFIDIDIPLGKKDILLLEREIYCFLFLKIISENEQKRIERILRQIVHTNKEILIFFSFISRHYACQHDKSNFLGVFLTSKGADGKYFVKILLKFVCCLLEIPSKSLSKQENNKRLRFFFSIE